VIATYTGFILATAWIYAIAAEVVNIVSMVGVISKVSHEVNKVPQLVSNPDSGSWSHHSRLVQ
jgi:hypothetical protein